MKPLKSLFKEEGTRKKVTLKKEKVERPTSTQHDGLYSQQPQYFQPPPVADVNANRTIDDPLDIDDIPTQNESDCDRMFLLSLLDSLKEIPEDYRFEVKMDMMKLIQRTRMKVRNGNKTSMANVKQELCIEESLDSMKEPSTPDLSSATDDEENPEN